MNTFIRQAVEADMAMCEIQKLTTGNMNWKSLYFGHVGKDEVQEAIKDSYWQQTRVSMKGLSLRDKYQILQLYLFNHKQERAYQVRVTNYVTALSRGGLIKPSDYLGG